MFRRRIIQHLLEDLSPDHLEDLTEVPSICPYGTLQYVPVEQVDQTIVIRRA
ncbi:MAG: hypothetical protein P8I91_03885 [Phycisphaerales bacterium]|nr:hypothetical protein [Phycisphaerales bacterium]